MSMSISGTGGAQPQVWSGASMRMPPTQKMANLYQQIDTSNSGSISKAQFEQAFQSLNPPANWKSQGADAIFSKLDPSGSGSVAKQDFISGMTNMMPQRQHHRHGAEGIATGSQTTSQTTGTAAASTGAASAGALFEQTLAASLNSLNGLGGQGGSGNSATPTGSTINVAV